MEDKDFRNIWNMHSSDLETNLEVDFASLKNANFKSTRLQLSQLIIRRFAEVLVFLFAFVLLVSFIINNNSEPQYVISGVILSVFSIIGVIGNARQLVLIFRLDYSKPVTDFLVQLEKLKLYSLQTLRLILLSIPFYFAYIVIGFKVLFGYDIYSYSNAGWLISNVVLSVLLVPFAIYIVSQLRVNAKRNWVKKMLADKGGKQIDSAIRFINEIVEYKKNQSIID